MSVFGRILLNGKRWFAWECSGPAKVVAHRPKADTQVQPRGDDLSRTAQCSMAESKSTWSHRVSIIA